MKSGKTYHLYSHGSENLFQSEENYRYFLRRYEHFIPSVADTLAYLPDLQAGCLMPNHIHFLIRVKTEADIESAFFDYHLEAREDPELTKIFAAKDFFKIDEKGKEITYGGRGKSGFTENFFDYEKLNHGKPWHRLLYSKDYFNFAIEGKHFEVKPDGEIVWKHNDKKN